ncbi:MAG: molybdate ABC transporter substrate-binding protein [Bryobacteraceae bacterium]
MNRLCLIALALSAAACAPKERPGVTVAAAANLTEVFRQLGPMFETQTGIHPVFSFASTAQLTQQIENGAPFDVIAAADAEHVEALEKKGLLLAGSRVPYAIGVLALWIPPGKAPVADLHDLLSPAIRVIAIAKPELAPYGQAAVDTLRKTGIWDRVESRVVYAENVRMAKQYGTTGNADAVFTAYSLVIKQAGAVIAVDETLHQPIVQEAGIMVHPQHLQEAQRFVSFLLGDGGRAILRNSGYGLPAKR